MESALFMDRLPFFLLPSMKSALFMDRPPLFLLLSMESALFMDRPICRPFRFSIGIFLYAENETFSNARVGICQRELLRVSVPAAVKLFHSSTILPVISISFTG